MEKGNTTNYLLFIILFTVILFVFTNSCEKKGAVTENFNDINISNYIEDNTEKLLNEKIQHEYNSTKEDIKILPEYKNGIKSRELKNKMEKFNNRLDELMNVNITEDTTIKEEVNTYIGSIEETDKDIYNSFILEYYKKHDDKIFKEDERFNENYNKIDLLKDNEENNNKEEFLNSPVDDNIQLETFIGKYFVLPYQYKEFDNVYMTISNKIDLDTGIKKGYMLSFYVLDELVCDFDIDLLKKQDTLFNLKTEISNNDDLENNLLGYEISIIKENANETFEFKYPKYRNGVKNMLNNLGVKENIKLYIFMVDNQYNKQYLNMDGTIDGMSEDAYFHKDVDDLFRIYSKNGATLLHLSKKNTIDKPFKSLVN